jgi:uncharacterized protein YifN (PemK superfamily)
MPIFYPVERGTILICDFIGFSEPEMVHRRPVIVLSPKVNHRPDLCTIVPLSTTEPFPVFPWNSRIRIDPLLPAPYDSEYQWIKGDMVYSLSWRRFYIPRYRDEEKNRVNVLRQLDAENMMEVERCVLAGLGVRV